MNVIKKIAQKITLTGMILSTVACGQMDPNAVQPNRETLTTEASHVVCAPSAFQQDKDFDGIADVCEKVIPQ